MNKTLTKFWNDFYKNVTYEQSYFRDEDQVLKWKSAGHTIENTIIHINQTAGIDYALKLSQYFPELTNIEIGLHKIVPGHYLPLHRDKYSFYRKKYNISNINNVVRYVVFLEDSKPGHYLVVNDTVYSSWKAGDAVGWIGDTIHSAINLGSEDRYTLQITGTHGN